MSHMIQRHCPLLSLPGELKNRIYRLVILVSSPTKPHIEITSTGYARSALLLTCKEIRNDATPIFYAENTFKLTVHNLNCNTYRKFYDTLHAIQSQNLIRSEDHVKLKLREEHDLHTTSHHPSSLSSSSPDLGGNLMEWLRIVHEGKIIMYLPSSKRVSRISPRHSNQRVWQELVGSMFDIAVELRDLEWERVRWILGGMQSGLRELNAGFAE